MGKMEKRGEGEKKFHLKKHSKSGPNWGQIDEK
jgi:hypothetical protein